MKNFWFSLFFILLMFSYKYAYAFNNHKSNQFELSAEIVRDESGEYEILISLSNTTDKDISMYEASLPWIAYDYFIQKVVLNDRQLKLLYPVHETSREVIKFLSGETKRGKLALRSFILHEDLLKKKDMKIFWNYHLKNVNQISFGERQGVIHLKF